jgi:hypothetical protein
VSADDGSPCKVPSELMGSAIGFIRNISRAPSVIFRIPIVTLLSYTEESFVPIFHLGGF